MSELLHTRLTRDIETQGLATLEGYRRWGGYAALEKGLRVQPADIAQAVSDSGLTGRGGAGFPTGRKWSLMPAGKRPRYLVCNADESEPGTFKDRYLMERNPHLVIEGVILAARAVEADAAFIYVRGEYAEVQSILERAVAEARAANLLGDDIMGSGWNLDIVVHGGAGAYICGEENALLESLAGNRGRPRPKPPFFPAAIGVYDAPTALNNVETLANVPLIVEHGADWFKSVGTEKSTGTRLLCLSGHVNRPGVYEVPQGIPMMALIDDLGGGMLDGRSLKAVQPGGSSSQFLTAEQCRECTLDAESIRSLGSMAGSGAVIVISEDQCIVEYTSRLGDFYYRESCGKCTPCREGTFWLSRVLRRMEAGGGRDEDVDLMIDVCNNIDGKSLCALGEAAAWPIRSSVQQFTDDYLAHVRAHGCPHRDEPANPAVRPARRPTPVTNAQGAAATPASTDSAIAVAERPVATAAVTAPELPAPREVPAAVVEIVEISPADLAGAEEPLIDTTPGDPIVPKTSRPPKYKTGRAAELLGLGPEHPDDEEPDDG
ncbi:MAG: NADH-quinone oxidoreductase subunit [Chloroflexota bacterium]|nr:NADH-quinone oxidoreductase subunit [Chloroflexota bacterium]